MSESLHCLLFTSYRTISPLGVCQQVNNFTVCIKYYYCLQVDFSRWYYNTNYSCFNFSGIVSTWLTNTLWSIRTRTWQIRAIAYVQMFSSLLKLSLYVTFPSESCNISFLLFICKISNIKWVSLVTKLGRPPYVLDPYALCRIRKLTFVIETLNMWAKFLLHLLCSF